MNKIIHRSAGALALLIITIFWVSTVVAEFFAGPQTIALVKTSIPYGFFVLIPALVTTGITGNVLAKKMRGPVIDTKKRRTKFAALNGILVLVPSAIFLSFKAQALAFDAAFYAVQFIELTAGAFNIALIGLNIRDGLRIAGRKNNMTGKKEPRLPLQGTGSR